MKTSTLIAASNLSGITPVNRALWSRATQLEFSAEGADSGRVRNIFVEYHTFLGREQTVVEVRGTPDRRRPPRQPQHPLHDKPVALHGEW